MEIKQEDRDLLNAITGDAFRFRPHAEQERLEVIALFRAGIERDAEARVVAWLRACSLSSTIPDEPAQIVADLADAIEAGEHHAGT